MLWEGRGQTCACAPKNSLHGMFSSFVCNAGLLQGSQG